jgi:hypothetical protein
VTPSEEVAVTSTVELGVVVTEVVPGISRHVQMLEAIALAVARRLLKTTLAPF